MSNKTTRLRRLKNTQNYGRNKIASPVLDLAQITTKAGDLIGFSVRIVNWEPWYAVYQEHEYESSDFYNGPDFAHSVNTYQDILLAFKGPVYAEQFNKQIGLYMKKIEDFVAPYQYGFGNENVYLRNVVPKFLGFEDK